MERRGTVWNGSCAPRGMRGRGLVAVGGAIRGRYSSSGSRAQGPWEEGWYCARESGRGMQYQVAIPPRILWLWEGGYHS